MHGRRAADAHEAEMRAKLSKGSFVDPHAGKVTFREYALRVIASRNLAPNTRSHYLRDCEKVIFPIWGHRPVRSLRHTDAVSLTTSAERSVSSSQAATAMVLARSIMRSAVLDGVIDRNPFAGLRLAMPRTRGRHVPEWAEIRAAVERPARTEYQRVTAMVVAALAGTGLRAGEMLGLAVEDIDFLRASATVQRQLVHMTDRQAREAGYEHGGFWFADAKTSAGQERVIPLPEFAVEALSVLAGLRPDPVTLPVSAPDAGTSATAGLLVAPFVPAAMSIRVSDAAARTGTRFSPHALRYRYATTIEQAGVALRTVQAVLGHAPAGVTLSTYVQVTPQSLAAVRRTLDDAWHEAAPAEETRVRLHARAADS